jgi:hypothetical protein
VGPKFGSANWWKRIERKPKLDHFASKLARKTGIGAEFMRPLATDGAREETKNGARDAKLSKKILIRVL